MEMEVDEGRRIPGYRRAAEECRQIKPTPSGDSTLSGFSRGQMASKTLTSNSSSVEAQRSSSRETRVPLLAGGVSPVV